MDGDELRIIGETAPAADGSTGGGYTVICGDGPPFDVDASCEVVECPTCDAKAELLTLVAQWWGMSKWPTISEPTLPPRVVQAAAAATASVAAVAAVPADGPPAAAGGAAPVRPGAKALPEATVSRARSDLRPAREALKMLAEIGDVEKYAAGAVILSEGEAGDCMYAIRKGIVELTTRDRLLDILEPGDMFGEMALLDGMPRSAAATATTDCTVIRVDRDRFMGLAEARVEFVSYVMRVMASRIRRLNDIAAAILSPVAPPPK